MPRKNFVAFFTLIVVFGFLIGQTAAGIVENGLVSYYSFNKINGEIAGDDWGDNDGTIVGPEVAKGKYGDALSFDGVDDYVNCGNAESLNLTKAITMETWVFMRTRGTYPALISKSDTTWGYILQFLTDTGQINLYLNTANPSWANIGKSAVPLEKWTHIVATYDGAKIRYYFNGEPDGDYDAVKAENSTNADELRIGRRRLAEPHNFDGIIDEVRIYDRALADAEVKVNMNSDSTAVSPANGLAVTWGKVKQIR